MDNPGAQAEKLAEVFLVERGVRILARNVRCKGGEIDLIGEQTGTIVFIEVRLRGNGNFGGAAASITPIKQSRLTRAAQYWLGSAGKAYRARPCRFDAVVLTSLDTDTLDWLQGIF